jgi:hypothetical protein
VPPVLTRMVLTTNRDCFLKQAGRVDVAVTPIREVLSSNYTRDTQVILTETFRGTTQFLQENTEILTRPSESPRIHQQLKMSWTEPHKKVSERSL